ncbi:MAG: PorT family protein [Bacteroidales bacterium]|nr:PorT family protein [Bacteroidales bacterium]
MKKIFASALCALCLITVQANAQNASESGRFRIGPKAALGFSTTNLSASHGPVFSYDAGVQVSYGLGHGMFLESGLLYAQKGVKWTWDGDRATPGYIDLPLNFGYEYAFNENFSIFAEAGLYLGVGVSGTYRQGDGYKWNYWNTDFSGGYKPNRFEMGIGTVIGVEIFRGLQIRLNYNAGLTRMSNNPNSARSFDTFMLGVAYMFL